MDDKTTRQGGRRWPAVVAGLIFVGAAIAGGCTLISPADARFVGKWNMQSRAVSSQSLSPWGTIEFRSNGTAVMQSAPGPKSIPFPWRADSATLTFGEKLNRGPELLQSISEEVRSLLAGSSEFGLEEDTYEILACTVDRVEVLDGEKACVFILTRIAK